MTATSLSVSWIDPTDRSVKLAKDANETRRQVRDFEGNHDVMAELLEAYRQLVEAANVARPLGWGGKVPTPQLMSSLRSAADDMDSRSLNHAARQLERYREEVKGALRKWWSEFAADCLGDVVELRALTATLGEVEGVVDLSGRLETILGELARAQEELPSARSVELLEEAGEVLAAMEQSLQPDSVRLFLSAVARGGAPLDLMNPDVANWLQAHHAENNFKIVAGSPTGGADA